MDEEAANQAGTKQEDSSARVAQQLVSAPFDFPRSVALAALSMEI
jgi:hypothetical protein